jgi:cytochrome c oxidase subunit 1
MISPHLEPARLEQERRELEDTWGNPTGVIGWLSHTEHKSIGIRFIVTAFGFFVLAGLLAALMRIQLARPNNTFLSVDLYNQVFTVHGTTMMFLLIIGPDNGWFSYPPLAVPEYSYGKRADVWAQLITFSEVSSRVTAICIIVTVMKMRAPGMSLNRIPLFVWSMVVVSIMILFAMPAIMISSTCLILDRLVNTHFFNQAEGGDPILWQHLFWFFGHPEVYIIFIPALGMISSIIPAFTKRAIFGYVVMVLSLVATAFIGFGVWVHHMFATGLPQLGQSFFTASSIMIVVPTALQLFCWIATLWTGRIEFKTPLLYVLAFFFVFVIGGLSGVMIASVPLDLQVHDTFFIVAHFHYVLIGGAVFPLLGAVHFWFPKITGRMLSEGLGRIGVGLLFVGFNLTFFPMHTLGLMGMPRRVYTYQPELGWGGLNLLASAGAAVMTAALLIYLANIVISLRHGAAAGSNPWGASTLEWSTTSPPPSYNYHPGPTVSGRDPLWHPQPDQPVVVGFRTSVREVLITHVLDAEPDHVYEFPPPSIWPFVSAVTVGIMFIGSIFTPWAVIYGSIPPTIALILWFWPRKGCPPEELAGTIRRGEGTPLEQVL